MVGKWRKECHAFASVGHGIEQGMAGHGQENKSGNLAKKMHPATKFALEKIAGCDGNKEGEKEGMGDSAMTEKAVVLNTHFETEIIKIGRAHV